MPNSNYTGGFAHGVTIRNMPVLNAYSGKVFWVDSVFGSNGNKGTFDKPLATVNKAFDPGFADVDNRGDIIMVKAGHAENLTAADAIDMDTKGVAVVGLGNGPSRPTFTMTNTAGEITWGADNVTLENVIVNASEPDVLKGLNIETGINGFSIINVELGVDNAGTDEFVAAIDVENGSTGSLIEGCLIDQALGNAVAGIRLSADTDQLTIRNNTIRGDYSTANITGLSTLSTDILVENNYLMNGESGNLNAQPCIQLLTNTTGMLIDNHCFCNVVTGADSIVADLCMYSGNKYSETVGAASFDLPLRPEHLIQVAIKNGATDDTDDLFDVTNGNCFVYALYATCEVDGDQSPVISLLLDADTGSNEVLATGINTSAVNAADTMTITSGAIAINASGSATAVMDPIVVRPGVIETVKDSGTSGAGVYKWHCVWAPIDVGAVITEAS